MCRESYSNLTWLKMQNIINNAADFQYDPCLRVKYNVSICGLLWVKYITIHWQKHLEFMLDEMFLSDNELETRSFK